jgi:polar amino acid transport system permease protein
MLDTGKLNITEDFSKIFSNKKIAFFLILSLAILILSGECIAASSERTGVLETVLKWFPLIFAGFLLNLLVSVLSMAIGTIVGVFLGITQMSQVWAFKKTARLLTQFFRNSPWLVLVFYTILVFPFEIRLFNHMIPFPSWLKATIGLSLPVMANTSEIVRGGIQSVPIGQWESAESLAFGRLKTMWLIIIPQCFKQMIPPWMNLYAILTTASPLISLVGINDALSLTRAALEAEGGRIDLLLPMYASLLIMFFIYCYPIAVWTVRLEKRYAEKH